MNYFSKNKWASVMIIILLVLNVFTLAFFWLVKAGPIKPLPPQVQSPAAIHGSNYLVEQLDLSAAQQNQYEQLVKEHQQQVRSIRDSVRIAKDHFFSLLNNNTISEEQIKDQAASSCEYQERLDLVTFDHFKKVKAICTPAQQVKFEKIIQRVIRQMAPPPPPPPPPSVGKGLPNDNTSPPPPEQ
jgi:protein CpxP